MSFLKKLSITQWIIIAMIVGTLIGWLATRLLWWSNAAPARMIREL